MTAAAGRFEAAVRAFLGGAFAEAVGLAEQVITEQPRRAEAHAVLGLARYRTGAFDAAVASLQEVLRLEPDNAEGHSNLGAALRAAGRRGEAEAALRAALARRPSFPDALNNLANVLIEDGRPAEALAPLEALLRLEPARAGAAARLAEVALACGEHARAIAAYRAALAGDPQRRDWRRNLALALALAGEAAEAEAVLRALVAEAPDDTAALAQLAALQAGAGRLADAETALRRSLQADTAQAQVWSDLADVLRRLGRPAEAEAAAREALARQPDLATAANNLGNALVAQGRALEAEAAFDRALAIAPRFAAAHNNRALALMRRGQAVAAEAGFREAMALDPSLPEIGFNLGTVLMDQARLDEAEAAYRTALAARPENSNGHGSLLFCLNYQPWIAAEAAFAEYRRWDAAHAARWTAEAAPHDNDPPPGRRLRLGYVSPDFKAKSAAYFIEPILRAHDRAAVEIFLYAEVGNPDATTENFRGLADHWRSTAGLSHADMAALIRADRIDVLVDLGGHTADNRLIALARKPAPVQIAYLLGHGYTSGLSAMDGFLADAALAPAGSEPLFSEAVLRLPRIPLAYAPPAQMPEVAALPARRKGHVTFGCFSRTVRINGRVVRAWARILRGVPGARLVLNSMPFAEAATRELFLARFAEEGIAAERLDLVYTHPQPNTWAAYGEIDIALDPFPHNAGTTTIEALWLGVPSVSLAGRPSVGRFGASILGAVGLSDWVVADEDAYVARAVAAAGDLDGLADLRAGLRARFAASPLADAQGLARAMEGAYRTLWTAWCERRKPAQPPQQSLVALLAAGDRARAEAQARGLLAADPSHVEALQVLGLVAYQRGDHKLAIGALGRAAALQPDPRTLTNAGAALRAGRRLAEAEAAYRRALSFDPDCVDAAANLGNLLVDLHRASEARTVLERAARLAPDRPHVLRSLALACLACDAPAEAEAPLRQALALAPEDSEVHETLAATLRQLGRSMEAEQHYRKALPGAHDRSRVLNNLAVALQDQVRLEEAEAAFRAAIAANPGYAAAHANLLFCLNYRTGLAAPAILAEYRRFDARFCAAAEAAAAHDNDRSPERRLRVAYLSPDFRRHSAALFTEPLIGAHDPRAVEIFLYAEVASPDDVSARFQALAQHWRPTIGLSDAALAAAMRRDGIDIAVDMGGHTASSRLKALGARPAPVQIAYLVGHGSTSGMAAIDAFAADAALAPRGAEAAFSEKLVRLARIPLVYRPPDGMPPPAPLPAARKGHVTFGSFSRLERVNAGVVAAWSRILQAVPGSRLMLNSKPFAEATFRDAFAGRFAEHGIGPERLDLVYTTPQPATWAAYGELDIALDPFPHNAGTTTIEALWLGVPVVSLADRPPVGRFGASILGSVGMADWVAEDVGGYVHKAVAAARDLDRLAALRAGLRARFAASPLRDAAGLARVMEATYRTLWRQWCAHPQGFVQDAAAG